MTTHITVSSHTINEGMMTLIFSFLLPEPLYIEIEMLLNLLWEKNKKQNGIGSSSDFSS